MPIPVTPVAAAPTVPDSSDATATFDAQYEAFNAWEKNNLQPEVNALAIATYANALSAYSDATAAAGAATAAGAIAWVSGTTYAIGNQRYSPIDIQTYRRKTAGAGTTDPSADTTNWARVNLTPQAGGALETTSATSITLTADSARVQAVNMTAQLQSVNLPSGLTLQSGGAIHVIKNTGAYTFSVRDSASGLLTTIAPGQCAAFYLTNNTTAAGVWAVGNHTVAAQLYPGIVTTINAVATMSSITVAALSATQAIVVYQASTSLKARTLNIDGNVITMGAEYAGDGSTATLCYGLAAMSATQAILTWVTGSVLKCRTLDVSGTTITGGTVLSPTTTAFPTGANIVKTTSTTALITYMQSTSNLVHCMTLSVSGTTLTNGTESTGVSIGSGTFPSITMLSATLCLITYLSSGFCARTVTISGTSATINGLTTVTSLANSNNVSVMALSATLAVASFGYSSPAAASVALLTISGTTVTAGQITQPSGDTGVYSSWAGSFVKISATQFAMILTPGSGAGNGVRLLTYTVVGSALQETSHKSIPGSISVAIAMNSPQLAALSATQFVAVYSNALGYPVANTLELAL